jgi:malonate-semialdehyde dehydrogenase (acetylating)/methylmalonate-semialdehyde dehydrogenase
MKYEPVRNFIDGTFQNATSKKYLEIISPPDGNKLSEVPLSSPKDLDDAVNAGNKAFRAWSKTPIKERVQVFFRYKYLPEKHLEELAELCSEENGKTIAESIVRCASRKNRLMRDLQ